MASSDSEVEVVPDSDPGVKTVLDSDPEVEIVLDSDPDGAIPDERTRSGEAKKKNPSTI